MEANFEVQGEVLIVELKGRLELETSGSFRRTCLQHLVTEKVVFDLKNLNFVGSLGLKDFVDTLDHMSKKSQPGVRFCGVSSEFRRLFEAGGLKPTEIYDSREKAVQSFFTVPDPAPSII